MAGGSGSNETLGRFSITTEIRYYLPLETALRIIVLGYNGSTEIIRLEETITQTESVEQTITFSNEYTFPLASLREGTYSIGFDATVEYTVEGSWYYGDDGSAVATVSIRYPHMEMEATQRTVIDDIKKVFIDFYEWWRSIFE
jgi:hypothetical protein